MGDKGDIILADLSQYVIGMRREMNIAKSGHVGFVKDETYSAPFCGRTAWAGGRVP